MSQLMARIMLAVFMLPVSMLFYVISFAVLYRTMMNRREESALFLAGLVTAAFVGAYWLLLWRRSVRWTRPRMLGSVGVAFGAVAIGVLASWGINLIENDLVEFIFGPVITFAWLLGTVFVWRETTHERASRLAASSGTSVVCPACGSTSRVSAGRPVRSAARVTPSTNCSPPNRDVRMSRSKQRR